MFLINRNKLKIYTEKTESHLRRSKSCPQRFNRRRCDSVFSVSNTLQYNTIQVAVLVSYIGIILLVF